MASTHELKASRLFSMKDHVCLVTGGGSGIGLMATQALAANGAKVYITGRNIDKLEAAAAAHNPSDGGQIIPLGPCDVTSKHDLDELFHVLEKKEGRLNLLVTNAGISGPKAEPKHSSASALKAELWKNESFTEWSNVMNTNVSSVYFTTVAFLPLLQAAVNPPSTSTPPPPTDSAKASAPASTQTPTQDQPHSHHKHHPHHAHPHGHLSPSVIVISSMSGIMRHAQGHFSYNAAKGATVHLSKLMSAEFQKSGIRVNSIAPGYFPSEMTVQESNEEQKSHMPAEKIKEKGYVPAERPGQDEEMGMAVLFLAKNRYVNGEVVAVDGGVLNVVAGR